jgi:putative FmdB family regulatory protein
MPLYEYECDACHQRFERIQKFSDPPLDVCPKCGKGPVRKLVSSPAIQFKGSGWYITDYARKSGTESANKSGTTSSESSSTTSATDAAAAPADKSQKSSDKTEKKP